MMNDPVIITMTTVPARLNTTLPVALKTLCNLNYDNYELHLNIPMQYALTGEEYEITESFCDAFPKVKIFRVDKDMGPKTKIIPTLQRVKDNELIITADDDIVYNRDLIQYHLKMRKKYPVAAVGFSGTKDGRLVLTPKEDIEVDILDNYKTASYQKWWFGEDFYKYYALQNWNDDIVVSSYLRDIGVKKIVAAYDQETFFVPRVASFPIVRLLESSGSGCDLIRGHTMKSSSPELQEMYEGVKR